MDLLDRRVRVLVVDDDPLVRTAVEAILSPHGDIEVIGLAASGPEAIELARARRPDVVLMDIQMPDMDGIEATRLLLEHVDTQVAAMTSIAGAETVARMLEAGAYGYVLKESAPADLATAVLTVARGDAFLSPRHTKDLVTRLAVDSGAADRRRARALVDTLTERELAAARLVAAGASDDEIASALHLAPSTVKSHIQQARLKLGARNRTLMAVIVDRAGLGPAL